MDGFSLSTNISEPPKAVFAFLADAANMARWYEAIDEVAICPGTHVGKGSRFQLIRSLPGGRAVNVVEVTEYEPDRRLTLESRSGPTPFLYAYTLDATDEGTALTLDGQISAEGLPGPAGHLGPLAARLFARGMKRNLRTLKYLLEVEGSRRSPSLEGAAGASESRQQGSTKAAGGACAANGDMPQRSLDSYGNSRRSECPSSSQPTVLSWPMSRMATVSRSSSATA